MMSSILNSDFISVRLLMQGMSLGKVGMKHQEIQHDSIKEPKLANLILCCGENLLIWTDVAVIPLVEENKHRDTVQRLSREHRQKLDTRGGYLNNVG